MRILVVEDEKRIADFLSRGLESGGYTAEVAGDGATALEMVHATEYDLIILDLGLPIWTAWPCSRKSAPAKPARRY